MRQQLKLALAQLNPVVGDIAGNLNRARGARAKAAKLGSDVVVFSELFITGYPPEDLVLKPAFQAAARAAVETLGRDTQDGGPAVIIGAPWVEEDSLFNSAVHLDGGAVRAVRHKVDLPNYGVFDEKRLFAAGPMPGPIDVRGVRIGVPICEDIWREDICECLEESGAEILVVPNGSPFTTTKQERRLNVAVARVTESALPLVYLNQTGGQDELVFDGASFVLNGDRSLALQLPGWEETVGLSEWVRDGDGWNCEPGACATLEEGEEAKYLACVLGLRDYVAKNRFAGVVLGLSGGIDSALCAAIAADALGAEKVHCVMMPYRYTSDRSLRDARACAEALGVRYDIVPIEQPVSGFGAALEDLFHEAVPDVTEENIQSRARGTILMAISNKFGDMVLTTGNKSEVSVGYATLYGDMNGGFNPIKDLYKTEVFALARYRNETRPKGCLGPDGAVIPDTILTKPPSAELREGQTDQDSLPPYDQLDDILRCLIEEEMAVKDIIARGHEAQTVEHVQHLLYIAEYKRRQAAPGVRISPKHFGRDRRYPITNAFRDGT